MANNTGIKKMQNGNYEVRIVINRKNLKVNTIRRSDDDGNPFKTQKEARDFRDTFIIKAKEHKEEKEVQVRDCTLCDVYEKYMSDGTASKAPATIRKQQSMWENHIGPAFGSRLISEITLSDLKNYLEKLYTYGDGYTENPNYSYKYVEGFLKFFYLLFGRAYADDYLSTERYTKMFLDKNSRLSMPEITQEDKEEYENVKIYSKSDLAQLDAIFKRGNCYIAFLCGYYLGLRISEVFALQYSDFDMIEHTVKIDKQLLYQDGVWCLCPVKTLKSVRTIDVPPFLCQMISRNMSNQMMRMDAASNGDYSYRNTEVVIDKTKKEHKKIQGGLFINRKENGELLTPNSIKYWSKVIKAELGIEFKFHSLRKTHATMMANMNTPAIELMQRLGHKKYDTTLAYYINSNALARETLIKNLGGLEYSSEDIVRPEDGEDPYKL